MIFLDDRGGNLNCDSIKSFTVVNLYLCTIVFKRGLMLETLTIMMK